MINEEIASEIQKLSPSSMIELFELDTTELGGDIFRFHNGTNKLSQNLVWQGNEYIRFPIQVTGFQLSGQGQFPRPQVTVSNVQSAITIVMLQYADLLGAKFTRKRTLLKYLDAVNFPGGVNPDADDTVYLPDDIFYVDRKAKEDRDTVVFELASATDLQGVKVPKRTVIQSTCPWIYRGPDCGYTGVPLYDENDNELPYPTSAEAIAMRDAFEDLKDAQVALEVAQQNLVDASNAYTAAQQYTTTVHYGREPGNFPTGPDYVAVGPFGTSAYWNDVLVSVGSTYQAGNFRESIIVSSMGGLTNFFEIVQYSRDEGAVAAAQAAYDAAVIARDDAIQDLADAEVAFDAALAAVPADDPVFTQDRCGKRLTSCRIRFDAINPSQPLPFGGFPGVAR